MLTMTVKEVGELLVKELFPPYVVEIPKLRTKHYAALRI